MSGASKFVYSPATVADLGYKYLRYRNDNKELAVDFPVKKLADRVYPMMAGEVMSIIARPGHMKTGLMMYWARERAKRIKSIENRVAVYATWEQSIEELHSFHVAAEQQLSITKMARGELTEEDFQKAMTASASRIDEPLFFIGHSVMRRSGRTQLTVKVLGDALESIQADGFTVDSVYVDYLQRIAPENPSDPQVKSYTQIMDDLKNLALGFGVPMTVGVQASREVEELKLPIPEMHHAQWTSNIEQSSDRVLSLVRPIRHKKQGEVFGSKVVEGQSQLLVTVLKQKLAEANFSEWISFNPAYNKLNETEEKYGGVE